MNVAYSFNYRDTLGSVAKESELIKKYDALHLGYRPPFKSVHFEVNEDLTPASLIFKLHDGKTLAACAVALPGFWSVENRCSACEGHLDTIESNRIKCLECDHVEDGCEIKSYIHFENQVALDKELAKSTSTLIEYFQSTRDILSSEIVANQVMEYITLAGNTYFNAWLAKAQVRSTR